MEANRKGTTMMFPPELELAMRERYRREALEMAERALARELPLLRRRLERQIELRYAEEQGVLPSDQAIDLEDGESGSNVVRRRRRWGVGHSPDLKPTERVLLHAILLRQGPSGEPMYAGPERLAHDTSLSLSRTYALLRSLAERGILSRTPSKEHRTDNIAVIREPSDEARGALYVMWRRGHAWELREWNEAPRQDLWAHRYDWIRELRDAPLRTPVKGLAFALDLLSHSGGLLYSPTSLEDLARLSGYCAATVRRGLHALDEGGWVEVRRPPGERVRIRLTWPLRVFERLQLRRDLEGIPW